MIKGLDQRFKLYAFRGGRMYYPDYYNLLVDEVSVGQLPPAPPIKKEDIPIVCQSDNLEYRGEVTNRITFNVFIEGILCPIVAEHNRRSLYTFLEVNGKIEKHWEGITLA